MNNDRFNGTVENGNRDKISGYELVKGILNVTDNKLEKLIECADGREQEWVEFKAGMRLLPEDKEAEKDEDLWWNITKGVISMMNTTGGAVVIGVRNDLEVVPLEQCDPRNLIGKEHDLDRYFREEILSRICPRKQNWKTSKGKIFRLGENSGCIGSKDLLKIKSVVYRNHTIALLLVKPNRDECIRVYMHNEEDSNKEYEKEIVYYREKGVGEVKEKTRSKEINAYEANRVIEDEDYVAILKKAKGSSRGSHSFFSKCRMMFQKLEGMQSLLQRNEHDALESFCGIVEKGISDMNEFCNGSRRDLSLEGQEIQQVWQNIKMDGKLEQKLNIESGLQFPDLSSIFFLKELDRQNSPKLKLHLPLSFQSWLIFLDSLISSFPPETEDEANYVTHNLPRFESEDFIGRKEQLDELLRFLSNREARSFFLTITGEGGMGKTTLAKAAAYAVLNMDPKTSGVSKEDLVYQNIIWATAKNREFQYQEYPIDPPDYIKDYGGLLDTILRVVDPDPVHSLGDSKSKQDRVRKLLQGTRSLLIVDNMETIDDVSMIPSLLRYIPAPTKIIGTDRNRPQSERAIRLPPMDREESKSLIKSLAKDKTANFTEEDYLSFYELSHGIPKVIEWGCRLLTNKPIGVEELFDYLRKAKKGDIYEYMFGHSYNQLKPESKRILNTLALFDFPIQCSLIGKLTEEEGGLVDCISDLFSYTLITICDDDKRSILDKHVSVEDYIREYAEIKAESNPDFDKYQVSLTAKKVFLDEIIRKCGKGRWPRKDAYEWCNTNDSMIQWCFEQLCNDSGNNVPSIHAFISSVIPVLRNIGMPDQIDYFCRKSLVIVLNIFGIDPISMELSAFVSLLISSFRKVTDSHLKNIAADIMERLAWNMFLQARNNFAEVSRILNALREVAPEIESTEINILVLRTLGLIDKEEKRLDIAVDKLLEVVEMSKQSGNLHIEAITYGALGSTYREKHDLEKACQYMEKAFSTLDKIDDQASALESRSVFLQKHANLLINSGKIEEAEQKIDNAMEIDRKIGRQYGFAQSKRLKALIYEKKKEYSQAWNLIQEARKLFVRLKCWEEVESDYNRIKNLYDNQQFT